MHRNRRVASISPAKGLKKARTISPASRIKGRIHLHNKQLPKFMQIDHEEVNKLLSRQELTLTLNIPLISHTRKHK